MKRTAELSQPPVLFLLNAGQRCKARVVAQEFASTSRAAAAEGSPGRQPGDGRHLIN